MSVVTMLNPEAAQAASSAWADLLGRLERHTPDFSAPEVRPAAVAGIPAGRSTPYLGRQIVEGRAFRVEVGAGTVALRTFDPNRLERRTSLNPLDDEGPIGEVVRHQDGTCTIRGLPAFMREDGLPYFGDLLTGYGRWLTVPNPPPNYARTGASTITQWSRRSRARMLRHFAELDYAPLFDQPGRPAMVTLTYPGEWLSVAPDGAAVKAHFRAWVERFFRTFGYRPSLLWKLEFQRRGAPHIHLFMCVPTFTPGGQTFRAWLSSSWAAVVDHPDVLERMKHESAGTNIDFGKASRATDPRRLASYFLKHGTKTKDDKEYQHFVPRAWRDAGASPGRFWGFQGLTRTRVFRDVDLENFLLLRRTLRRHSRSRGRSRCYSGGRLAGGWTLVTDGPAFAADLARYLQLVHAPPPPSWQEHLRLTGEIRNSPGPRRFP